MRDAGAASFRRGSSPRREGVGLDGGGSHFCVVGSGTRARALDVGRYCDAAAAAAECATRTSASRTSPST